MVTLLYHRKLSTAWEAAAEALRDALAATPTAAAAGIRPSVIGRSRKQVHSRSWPRPATQPPGLAVIDRVLMAADC